MDVNLCAECGASFTVPSYRKDSAKYCSNACQKRGSGKSRRGRHTLSLAGRQKLSVAAKERHLAGIYKVSVSDAANAKRAASMRNAFATGRAPRFTERKAKAARALGDRMRGRPIPVGAKSSAGPSHFAAKFWLLRTPDRNWLIGPNLNEIIRRNVHLFDPGDVTEPIQKSRARKGLSSLFEACRKYVPQSWKGWTALNKAEMVKDVGVPFDRLKFKPEK